MVLEHCYHCPCHHYDYRCHSCAHPVPTDQLHVGFFHRELCLLTKAGDGQFLVFHLRYVGPNWRLPILCIRIWLTQSTAFITLTDVMFSLLPITFMYNMNLPLRQKIVLYFLMALGFFASSVVVIRTTTFRRYKRTGDKLWYMVDITIWNLLEGELGIIAACVPYLKSTFDHALKRLGFLKESEELHGATSVRISDYNYDMEFEEYRRRRESKVGNSDEADISVAQIIPDTDTEISSVPTQGLEKDNRPPGES